MTRDYKHFYCFIILLKQALKYCFLLLILKCQCPHPIPLGEKNAARTSRSTWELRWNYFISCKATEVALWWEYGKKGEENNKSIKWHCRNDSTDVNEILIILMKVYLLIVYRGSCYGTNCRTVDPGSRFYPSCIRCVIEANDLGEGEVTWHSEVFLRPIGFVIRHHQCGTT